MKASFFDIFFWIVSAITLLAVFSDWYIGKEGRDKAKAAILDLKFKIDKKKIHKFGSNEAFALSKLLSPAKSRRPNLNYALTVTLTFSLILIVGLNTEGGYKPGYLPPESGLLNIFGNIGYMIKLILLTIVLSLISTISWTVTAGLLQNAAKSKGYLKYVVISILDLFLAILIAILILYISFIFRPDPKKCNSNVIKNTYDQIVQVTIKCESIDVSFIDHLQYKAGLYIDGAASFISIVPSIVHLSFVVILTLSILVFWFWNNFFSTVLYRLFEDKRGVITLIAIFLASCSKIVQEFLKAIN